MSRTSTFFALAFLLLALCIPARSAPVPQPAPNPLPAPASDLVADALAAKLAAISKQISKLPKNPKGLRNPKLPGLRLTRKSSIAPLDPASATVTSAPVLATEAVLMKRWPPTEAPTGTGMGGAGVFTPGWGPIKIAPPKYVNPKFSKTGATTTTGFFIPTLVPIKIVVDVKNPKNTRKTLTPATTFKPTAGPVKIARSTDTKIWTGKNGTATTHPGAPRTRPTPN